MESLPRHLLAILVVGGLLGEVVAAAAMYEEGLVAFPILPSAATSLATPHSGAYDASAAPGACWERLHLSSCSNSGAQDARGEEHPSFFPTDPKLQIAPAAPSGLAVDPLQPWHGTPGIREVLCGNFMHLCLRNSMMYSNKAIKFPLFGI